MFYALFNENGPRRKRRVLLRIILPVSLLAVTAWWAVPKINFSGSRPGTVLDSLDGVYVYNNGPFAAIHGRNLSETGYNIGLKYQCVEFVKRYYLYRYGHEMPDSYGHAKDFFDTVIPDGALNPARGLKQFANGSPTPPRKGDLFVFGPSITNRFGHVAIVSEINEDYIEVVQQNVGARTRDVVPITYRNGVYRVNQRRVRGWLRYEEN